MLQIFKKYFYVCVGFVPRIHFQIYNIMIPDFLIDLRKRYEMFFQCAALMHIFFH